MTDGGPIGACRFFREKQLPDGLFAFKMISTGSSLAGKKGCREGTGKEELRDHRPGSGRDADEQGEEDHAADEGSAYGSPGARKDCRFGFGAADDGRHAACEGAFA